MDEREKLSDLLSDDAFNTLLSVYDEWSMLSDPERGGKARLVEFSVAQSYLFSMAELIFITIGNNEKYLMWIKARPELRQNYARFKRFFRDKAQLFIPPGVDEVKE